MACLGGANLKQMVWGRVTTELRSRHKVTQQDAGIWKPQVGAPSRVGSLGTGSGGHGACSGDEHRLLLRGFYL